MAQRSLSSNSSTRAPELSASGYENAKAEVLLRYHGDAGAAVRHTSSNATEPDMTIMTNRVSSCVINFLAAFSFAACSRGPAASLTPGRMLPPMPAPPSTPIRAVVDTIHGVVVTDPYRWLENVNDSSVRKWMLAQRTYADSVLALMPERSAITAELDGISARPLTRIGLMHRVGAGLVYQRRDPGESGMRYVFRDRLDGPDRTVLTPAQVLELGPGVQIASWYPSPDGSHILVKAVVQGRETGTVRVFNTRTRAFLSDAITDVYDLGGAGPWRPDGKAFLYRRSSADQPFQLHELGKPAAQDRIVLGKGISKGVAFDSTAWTSIEFSQSSRWALAVLHRFAGSDLYVAPVDSLNGAETPWRQIAGPREEIARHWALHRDAVYAMSHLAAERFRVVRMALDDGTSDAAAAPREVLGEDKKAVIVKLAAASDALYVMRQRDGISQVLRVPYDGSGSGLVPMPFDGAGAIGTASPLSEGFVFPLHGWVRSPHLFFAGSSGQPRSLDVLPPNPADSALRAESIEVEARSADGTMVPLSIVHPRGMLRDGNHPARLEVYGSNGVSIAAYYAPYYAPWYKRGGVQAQCYPRGGGERGAQWHEQGRKERLGNRIADMVACAEYLVTHGYSAPGRIAAIGVSAGGITAGAAAIARPDLFGAAALTVPVVDLLRREFNPGGKLNTTEYGTIQMPEEFRVMHSLSPVENVRRGVRYPRLLLSTGINDQRVSPAEPSKLAARVQAAHPENTALLFVNFGAGHGLPGPTIGNQLAFLLWALAR